jgi:hypothetical protein
MRLSQETGRPFEELADHLDACQAAWRKLLDETGRIASIATRDWAIIGQTIWRLVLRIPNRVSRLKPVPTARKSFWF